MGDLPEQVITELAKSRERNEAIASHYVANKDRYGKTLIFADRWYQCDALREALKIRGLRRRCGLLARRRPARHG